MDSENNNKGRRMEDHQQKAYDDKVRLGHLEREMGGIKGEVGLLKVAMTDNSAKLSGMQEQMHNISRSFEKMADRVHEPKAVNWGWLISGAMAILLIAGSYTSIVTEPLKGADAMHHSRISTLDDQVHSMDQRLSYQEGFAAGLSSAEEK